MYKGFFEDVEYVMGLFFKPFENCCDEAEDKEEDDEKKCDFGCDFAPCMKEKDEEKEDEDKDEDKSEEEAEKEQRGGLFSDGPLMDIMKCMFDASDIDYDYED